PLTEERGVLCAAGAAEEVVPPSPPRCQKEARSARAENTRRSEKESPQARGISYGKRHKAR
ncbi:hypothetical protein MRX96_042929, partial [Rhipicephalus microplus]